MYYVYNLYGMDGIEPSAALYSMTAEDETVLFLRLHDITEPFRTWKVAGEKALQRHMEASQQRGFLICHSPFASKSQVDYTRQPLTYTEMQTKVSPTRSGSN